MQTLAVVSSNDTLVLDRKNHHKSPHTQDRKVVFK